MQKISDKLQKEYQEKQNIIEKDLENKYKLKENEMQKKYNQMPNLLENRYKNNNISNLNLSKCNTFHYGIKCQNCQKEPIIGYRYKCSQCSNYNLCQDCEDENSHPHNFIKMRNAEQDINKIQYENRSPKISINKDDDNDPFPETINKNDVLNINNFEEEDNKINNRDKEEGFNIFNNDENGMQEENEAEEDLDQKYSFECINKSNLIKEIMEGESKAKISVALKNNSNATWPKDQTKLICDLNSNFILNDIPLSPQKYNEIKNYDIYFRDLDKYPTGDYKSILGFEINGKQIGEQIEIKIIIKESNNDELEKVNSFRDNYSLSKEDYSDGIILDLLKAHNFKFEEAFSSLFT